MAEIAETVSEDYERGFKDGIKSECLKELKPLMVKLAKGCAEAIKGITPMLIDKAHLTIKHAVNRWIPCSERLPKSVGNKVIVFCTGEDVNDYVGFGHYEKYEGSEVWLNLETGKQFAEWGLTVQKWMPLPEPPKEGESDA